MENQVASVWVETENTRSSIHSEARFLKAKKNIHLEGSNREKSDPFEPSSRDRAFAVSEFSNPQTEKKLSEKVENGSGTRAIAHEHVSAAVFKTAHKNAMASQTPASQDFQHRQENAPVQNLPEADEGIGMQDKSPGRLKNHQDISNYEKSRPWKEQMKTVSSKPMKSSSGFSPRLESGLTTPSEHNSEDPGVHRRSGPGSSDTSAVRTEPRVQIGKIDIVVVRTSDKNSNNRRSTGMKNTRNDFTSRYYLGRV